LKLELKRISNDEDEKMRRLEEEITKKMDKRDEKKN
jgi:hypothetical protein